MNCAGYFSQSEMEKYFEWIIISSSNPTFLFKFKSMFLFCVCVFFTVIITPDLLIILNDSQNFLIHLLSRYVGINATEINHSAGRYHPGQSPPLEAGLEVRVKKIWSQDLRNPYTMEPRLTATQVIRPPRYYGHLVLAARKNGHTFSCKETLINTVTSLLWPIFFWPIGDRINRVPLYYIPTLQGYPEFSMIWHKSSSLL